MLLQSDDGDDDASQPAAKKGAGKAKKAKLIKSVFQKPPAPVKGTGEVQVLVNESTVLADVMKKVFVTDMLPVQRLQDPPPVMKSKAFDPTRVEQLKGMFAFDQLSNAMVVIWDLPDGHFSNEYSRAFDFGVDGAKAEMLQKMTADDFVSLAKEDRDKDWRGIPAYVIAGRHSTVAMKEKFAGKLFECHYSTCIY